MTGKTTYAWWNVTNAIHVEYGIERYCIAGGTGNPHGQFTTRAVVPAPGHVRLQ